MEVIELRTALQTAPRVWVETWNGKIIWGNYEHGTNLYAGIEDVHHKRMGEPKSGDPVIHIRSGGRTGSITGVSFVRRNYRSRNGYYFITLRGFSRLGISLLLFKTAYGNDIKQEILRNHPNRYPFSLRRIRGGVKSIVLLERGYIQRATIPLTKLFIDAISTLEAVDVDPGQDDYIKVQNDLRERACATGSGRLFSIIE